MSSNMEPLKLLALLPQVGFGLVFSVIGSVMLGFWLDRQLSSGSICTVICSVLGVVSGLYFSYKLLSRMLNRNNQDK